MNKQNHEEIKKLLCPKDNLIHSVMYSSASKKDDFFNLQYNESLNSLLIEMQKDGYEIIDIKISTTKTVQSPFKTIDTIIIYK